MDYNEVRLLDQVERLQLKLEQLNSKFNTMANSKAELSAQLVDCEEEKLTATKSYIDMQIQNNKLREEMESMHYNLNNKILTLEHDLQVSNTDRDSLRKNVANLRQQLSDLERDRKGLADEYINLKTSYMALTDDIDREIAKNDELTMELLNLINSKSALAQMADKQKIKSEVSALAREEERIRGVVHRLSHRGVNMEGLGQERKRQDFIEKELFAKQTDYEDQMTRLSEQYNDGRKQLLTQVNSLEKELASLRVLARERQQRISSMNARLITVEGENTELKAANNRLQHKLKDVNSEYRLRLTKYVEDIASHIDKADTDKGEESLAQYVNKMIKDMKTSHRAREDQLSQATHSYKNRIESVVHKHEALLCAYRDLRAQVEALGLDSVDLGPDEHELIMSDTDLQSSQQKKIVTLQTELHKLKISNKQLSDQTGRFKPAGKMTETSSPPLRPGTGTFADLDSWTSVRKQLRDFSEQTLRELEEERASLLSKNVILEEQLKESQDYIDKHLARYKEEINRLRQQLSYQTRS